MLAFSGYLTAAYDADSMSYRLRIPNREIYGVFSERILDRLEGTMSGRMRRLSAALLGNDVDGVTSSLTDLFEHVVSGRVLDDEHSYQTFIAGMLMNLFGNYRITADFESGSEYHDIALRRSARTARTWSSRSNACATGMSVPSSLWRTRPCARSGRGTTPTGSGGRRSSTGWRSWGRPLRWHPRS